MDSFRALYRHSSKLSPPRRHLNHPNQRVADAASASSSVAKTNSTSTQQHARSGAARTKHTSMTRRGPRTSGPAASTPLCWPGDARRQTRPAGTAAGGSACCWLATPSGPPARHAPRPAPTALRGAPADVASCRCPLQALSSVCSPTRPRSPGTSDPAALLRTSTPSFPPHCPMLLGSGSEAAARLPRTRLRQAGAIRCLTMPAATPICPWLSPPR